MTLSCSSESVVPLGSTRTLTSMLSRKGQATANVTRAAPATSKADGLSEPEAQVIACAMRGMEPTMTMDLLTPVTPIARANSAEPPARSAAATMGSLVLTVPFRVSLSPLPSSQPEAH